MSCEFVCAWHVRLDGLQYDSYVHYPRVGGIFLSLSLRVIVISYVL